MYYESGLTLSDSLPQGTQSTLNFPLNQLVHLTLYPTVLKYIKKKWLTISQIMYLVNEGWETCVEVSIEVESKI